MNLLELIKGLLSQTKELDITKLPTQGIFYPNDFQIFIKKADLEDIIEYEFNYEKDNLFSVIECVKKIVQKNTKFNGKYGFIDIKSVDVIYIFLEIVKFTQNKEINIIFFNDESGRSEEIEFSSRTFKYFDFSKWQDSIDKETDEIAIDGWRFSMPSIGVENCLTQFLIKKSGESDAKKWNDFSYDFLFFVGNKNNLTFSEIENLVTIFNFDLDEEHQSKVRSIVQEFVNVIGYNLQKNGRVVDIKTKLDLETIWKE